MSIKIHQINEQSCRLCFKTCPDHATNVAEIEEEFYETTGFDLNPHDKPRKICKTCLENLIVVQTFQEICEKAEKFLEEMRPVWKNLKNVPQEEISEENSKSEVENSPKFVRKYQKRKFPTKHRWQYDALKEYLRENRIEPSAKHLFVLDFETLLPNVDELPMNLDIDTYDDDNVDVSCTYCTYQGTEIRTHFEKDCREKRQKFRCPCSKEYFCLDLLRKHIARRHPNKRVLYRQLQCTFCQFTCCFETSMEKHCMMMHVDADFEICQKCGEIFHCEDLKLQHVVFRCNDADFSLQIPFLSILGSEPDATESCKLCNQKIPVNSMKFHIERDHEKLRYFCDLCGKNYNAKLNLTKHMQLAHLGRDRYPCQFCERIFRSWSSRRFHVKTKHSEAPLPHICEFCGKGYAKGTALKNHQATHSEARTVFCPECPAAFKNKPQLAQHRVRMHSEQQVACTICGKNFKSREHLRQHSLTHKARKYFCPACPAVYTVNNNLRIHVERKHPEIQLPEKGTILKNKDLKELLSL
ncbi:zinc finger protein 567-like [Culicoides brevitarsis]|uniref:zinc finger protein 567-like n=1 Tax=Culicoides brevitarsis TaxID=469753 RepID=UPI00307C536A